MSHNYSCRLSRPWVYPRTPSLTSDLKAAVVDAASVSYGAASLNSRTRFSKELCKYISFYGSAFSYSQAPHFMKKFAMHDRPDLDPTPAPPRPRDVGSSSSPTRTQLKLPPTPNLRNFLLIAGIPLQNTAAVAASSQPPFAEQWRHRASLKLFTTEISVRIRGWSKTQVYIQNILNYPFFASSTFYFSVFHVPSLGGGVVFSLRGIDRAEGYCCILLGEG